MIVSLCRPIAWHAYDTRRLSSPGALTARTGRTVTHILENAGDQTVVAREPHLNQLKLASALATTVSFGDTERNIRRSADTLPPCD